MKPIKLMNLVAWIVLSTTAGFLLPKIVIANGGAIPVSSLNIIVTLPAIGIVLLAMAIPMFQYRRALTAVLKDPNKPNPKRVNPFYAVRLVVLAKAIAISGSIFVGWHIGLVWLQLTSPIVPSTTGQNAFGLLGSAVMLVCAVIVERICRITDSGDANAAGNSEASAA